MKKKPWPTKDAMKQIYDMHLWGGHEFDFYSGSGSHHTEIVNSYIEALINFFKSLKESLVVCDLGCGDFNIGKQIVSHSKTYFAIDIVDTLIQRNKQLYSADNLDFQCLDISKDELPNGDCIILRQVLQHLSNTEIQRIVLKIQKYKYVILTEHIPVSKHTPNKDIISGQGIRLKKHSGVNLIEEPFNLIVMDQKLINEFILDEQHGKIVTMLYTLF